MHYALEDCASCHHPHYPLEMDFATIDEVKAVCLTCHSDQGQEMEAHPSEHAGLDCKECHMAHGEATECMECHDAHTEEMTYEGCLRCHKPHMPVEVTYGGDIPSSFCISCHNLIGKDLAGTTTKHHALRCVYCHENEHKAVLDCGICHGDPHSFDIHA
ncbi:MAG: cytochrome C, partial [Deltaproteobacteria bacterium]|nr:cytochrome C [Deltaproteobacteria bacterium]